MKISGGGIKWRGGGSGSSGHQADSKMVSSNGGGVAPWHA